MSDYKGKLPSNVTRTRGKLVKRFGVKIRFHGYSLRIGSAYCTAQDAGAVASSFRKVARIDADGEIFFDPNLIQTFSNVLVNVYLPFTTTKDTISVSDYLTRWLSEMKKKQKMDGKHSSRPVLERGSLNNLCKSSKRQKRKVSPNGNTVGKKSKKDHCNKLTEIDSLKMRLIKLTSENKGLNNAADRSNTSISSFNYTDNINGGGTSDNTSSTGSSNSTTDSSDENSYFADEKVDEEYDSYQNSMGNTEQNMLMIKSLSPNLLERSDDPADDDALDRNLLIGIDVDENVIERYKNSFIGIVEKISEKTTNLFATTGTANVTQRTRVGIFYPLQTGQYYSIDKLLFFSIRLRDYQVGKYKFTLKINTEGGLIESNQVDLHIVKPGFMATSIFMNDDARKRDRDDDNEDGGPPDDNFDEYNDFNMYDSSFNGSNGTDGSALGGNGFADNSYDFMFNNCKDTNHYCITTETWYDFSSAEQVEDHNNNNNNNNDNNHYDDSKRSENKGNKSYLDSTILARGREEGGIGENNNVRDNNNVDQNRCFGDNNDDNDNGLPRQSFTTNSIDKTKATGTLGERIWRSKHFFQYSSFIVLLLGLILLPSVERAKSNGLDPVLKIGAKTVEGLGITSMSRNVCSYLTSSDCSQKVMDLSQLEDYTKADYYDLVRGPVPLMSDIMGTLKMLMYPIYTFCYFCHSSDYYKRDRFGYRATIAVAAMEILKIYTDGYSMILSIPLIGALAVLHLFENILLLKYFNKESYARFRLVYNTIICFSLYLVILPSREWISQNYGKDLSPLVPTTILYSLQIQKIFSQGMPLLVGTRKKMYFPFDWVAVLFVLAFVMAVASSYTRTLNGDRNAFIVSICQIYPYYISSLLFSCTVNRLLQFVYIMARKEFETHIGPWDKPEGYVF